MPTDCFKKSMRNNCALLTLLMAWLTLAGEAQVSRYSTAFTVSRKDFADTIPISIERGQVTLPVRLNGKTYRFLLDTGASQTTLFDDTPIEGCQEAGYTFSHDAISARYMVSKVVLPPMTLGNTTFTGCHAVVQHRAVRRKGIDGIVGFDIICKGISAKIDTRRGHFILTDKESHFDREPGIAMRYRLDYHVPYIEVCPFGKYRERVLFDTGSPSLYVMNKKSFDLGEKTMKEGLGRQVEGRSTGRYAIGYGGVEPRGEVVFLALDEVKLGGYSLCNLHTLTTQGDSHLGAKLLEYGSVVFLPRRKRLCFQPWIIGQQRVEVDNQQFQKAVIPVDGKPVIGLIWEGSDAYQAGFREGDIILKADNQAFSSFADYVRFRPLTGHVYRFFLRDSRGFTKEVKSVW